MAGGYLRNTIREVGVTCQVCSVPVNEPYLTCMRCSEPARGETPCADRAASLIYAIEGDTQAYKLVKNYKAKAPGPSLRDMMISLLALGLQGHSACCMKLAGAKKMSWAVVPSTGRDDRLQPLRGLLLHLAKPGLEVTLTPAPNLVAPRDFDPANFIVTSPPPMPENVVLIDDSWVSGGHAQSAAATLKLAGVRDVSIFNVARVLRPTWEPNPVFIKDRLTQDFDPSICPWTGGACP
jgi:hypothetical protein